VEPTTEIAGLSGVGDGPAAGIV